MRHASALSFVAVHHRGTPRLAHGCHAAAPRLAFVRHASPLSLVEPRLKFCLHLPT